MSQLAHQKLCLGCCEVQAQLWTCNDCKLGPYCFDCTICCKVCGDVICSKCSMKCVNQTKHRGDEKDRFCGGLCKDCKYCNQ